MNSPGLGLGTDGTFKDVDILTASGEENLGISATPQSVSVVAGEGQEMVAGAGERGRGSGGGGGSILLGRDTEFLELVVESLVREDPAPGFRRRRRSQALLGGPRIFLFLAFAFAFSFGFGATQLILLSFCDTRRARWLGDGFVELGGILVLILVAAVGARGRLTRSGEEFIRVE